MMVLSWHQCLQKFKQDRKGMAAVEFALICPLLVLLYLGTAEVTQGMNINRKVHIAARTASDLASRATALAAADLTDILNAAESTLAPYNTNPLAVRINGILIDDKGKAKVAWSSSRRTTATPCGSAVTVPASLMPPLGKTGFLVLAETNYPYTPTVGYTITSAINLTSSLYTTARSGAAIPLSPGQCVL